MPLFDTPTGNDPRFCEATVLAVDNVRFVCKVFTQFKQAFDSVPWASNMYETPIFGDRVRVDYATGYPQITAILNRVGIPTNHAPNIDSDTKTDTGNYSTLINGLVQEPEKPKDIVSGDKVFSNPMGGAFGLLKGGTFFARASKLAQLIISKYDDLVRIVARSFEIFTDGTIDVISSVRGRVYRFVGYADTLANGRAGTFKYQETFGDTVAATTLQGNNYGYTPTTFAGLPAANDVIKKEIVLGSPNNLYAREIHLTGETKTTVQNAGGSSVTYVDVTNAQFDVKTTSGNFAQITVTPSSVLIQWNGTSTVTLDTTKVEAVYNSVTKCTLNSTVAQLMFVTNNNSVSADALGVELLFNGGVHFIKANSSGIVMG